MRQSSAGVASPSGNVTGTPPRNVLSGASAVSKSAPSSSSTTTHRPCEAASMMWALGSPVTIVAPRALPSCAAARAMASASAVFPDPGVPISSTCLPVPSAAATLAYTPVGIRRPAETAAARTVATFTKGARHRAA